MARQPLNLNDKVNTAFHIPFSLVTSQVRAHEEVNKMNALNLAIVFGPNLLWSPDQAASLIGLGEINSFVNIMIQNKDAIFI